MEEEGIGEGTKGGRQIKKSTLTFMYVNVIMKPITWYANLKHLEKLFT